MSRLVFDHAALGRAVCVLKFNQVPGWVEWVLNNRENYRVIHIVRHPGGMLNSWQRRYLSRHDETCVAHESRSRLQEIAHRRPRWRRGFGDLEALRADEMELHFWRYAAESIHEAGQNSDRYMAITYENLASNAENVAERVYEFCGAAWDEQIRARVAATTRRSAAIATEWRQRLSARQLRLVEKVLDSSSLGGWWSDEAVASKTVGIS